MANPTEVDVLLCTYDMGDSNPLKRLMEKFKSSKITYRILALGNSEEVFRGHPNLIEFGSLDNQWDRTKKLKDTYLAFLKETIKPKIVIAGMASAAQAQILNFFKTAGVYTVAFYDNFDAPQGKEYIQAFLKVIGHVDEYFLPSETTLSEFQKLSITEQTTLSVLGQPILEYWEETAARTDKDELRSRLSLAEKDQVILFVGGYDETYPKYFRLFVKSMKSFMDKKIFVTYHPKTDGSLEKKIIAEEGESNITVVDKAGPTTVELATISDVLVCHKSSVGIQALYVGLPVIYVVKKGELNNFAITQGLATEVETEEGLISALKRILSSANRNQAPIEGLGIPQHATENMIRRVKEILGVTSTL